MPPSRCVCGSRGVFGVLRGFCSNFFFFFAIFFPPPFGRKKAVSFKLGSGGTLAGRWCIITGTALFFFSAAVGQ